MIKIPTKEEQFDPRLEVIELSTVKALFDYLDPTDMNWREANGDHWIFRGQAEAKYSLTPKALRKGIWERHKREFVEMGIEEDIAINQVQKELFVIKKFIDACDKQGLDLPEDKITLRETYIYNSYQSKKWKQQMINCPNIWPPMDLVPILSMAQHYGVPTKLLDWTFNAMIAVFFAVKYIDAEDKEGNCAIWALNTSSKNPLADRLVLVQPPSAPNPNLAAQHALFTLIKGADNPKEPPIRTGFEYEVRKCLTTLPGRYPLIKIEFPKSEARKILYCLHLKGIDSARIFPGYDGAAKLIEERALWDYDI